MSLTLRRRAQRRRPRRAVVALAIVAGALTVPVHSAGAAGLPVFCVHVATCPAGGVSTGDDLQLALADAESNGIGATVLIGDRGSPYVGPFTFNSGRTNLHVLIEGIGPTRPVLTAAVGETILSGRLVGVQNVNFEMPSIAEGQATDLADSTLTGVSVSGEQAAISPGGTAVVITGTSTLSDVQITGGFDPSLEANGNISATGLQVNGGDDGVGIGQHTFLALHDSRIQGHVSALEPLGAIDVRNSTLVTTAPGSTAIVGAQDDVSLDHVTVAHEGAGDGQDTAIELHATFGKPLASLHAVALAGYSRGIVRTVGPGELFPVTVSDSVWDPAHDSLGGAGAGAFSETNDAHVAPALVDLAGGDLRPRGSSAQIDRDIQTPASGYVDLNGSPAVDGNGDGSVLPDAGALEYLHRPPVIDTTSVPSSTIARTTNQFNATTSDPDGDHLNVTWDFGDGATASGENATHTFASAGVRVVKLTATDEAGLTDRRTFQVAVSAGGQGTTAPPPPPPAPHRGHLRLAVTGVRLSSTQVRVRDARRLRLRFALNEAATVRLNAKRAVRSRLIAVRGTVVLRARAGQNSLSLLSSLRRLKLLRAGRLSLSITATDATGHSSAPHSVQLVLRR